MSRWLYEQSAKRSPIPLAEEGAGFHARPLGNHEDQRINMARRVSRPMIDSLALTGGREGFPVQAVVDALSAIMRRDLDLLQGLKRRAGGSEKATRGGIFGVDFR